MFEAYDDILTVSELAEALKIGTTHAYGILKRGELKAFKEGKDWKIPKESVIQYVLKKSSTFRK